MSCIQRTGRKKEVRMTPLEIPDGASAAYARQRKAKKMNALTALTAAVILGSALWILSPPSVLEMIMGCLLGIIWANAFEYIYHRWILHLPGSSFARGHLEHHRASGTPSEVEHVTFARSPLWIVLLFLLNLLPVLGAERVFDVRLAPGIVAAFALYYLAFEEIHWRIHLGGWLPRFLIPARAFHLSHHDRADARFNVFLPLFDWLLGTSHVSVWVGPKQPHPMP